MLSAADLGVRDLRDFARRCRDLALYHDQMRRHGERLVAECDAPNTRAAVQDVDTRSLTLAEADRFASALSRVLAS